MWAAMWAAVWAALRSAGSGQSSSRWVRWVRWGAVGAVVAVGTGRTAGGPRPPRATPPVLKAPVWKAAVPGPCVEHPLPGVAGSTFLAADITGSGCAEPLAWRDGVVLTVSPEGSLLRFRLGEAGDQLVVGHWTCVQAQLPAIYRPATGQVFVLDGWPVNGGDVSSAPAVQSGVTGGTAVTSSGPGCQRVEVHR